MRNDWILSPKGHGKSNQPLIDLCEAKLKDAVSSTAQQCVEILEKMRKEWITPGSVEENCAEIVKSGYNQALDEAISAIKKQFGIKE